ncbi:unnamed protein product [Pylaiella littoralis]
MVMPDGADISTGAQVPRFCVGIAAVELSEEYCPTLHFFSAPSMELPPVPRLLSAASKYYSATTLPLLLLLLSLLSLLPCTLVVRLVSSLILVTLEYYPHHSHLSLLLAYSDEATAAAKSVTAMEQMIGIAGVGTVGLFGLLASVLNLPQTAKIELTEEEQDAVTDATLLYDSKPALQELTEKGTIGEVKRRELAMSARETYQRGKDPREVRDKTLSYAEFDLPYLAKMLRLAKLDDGDVFLDLGSGTGKAVVAAGLLYPNLSVCRGVEILDGLHREAKTYARKYAGLRRPKAPIEFVQGEFMDEAVDVSDVDIVFAYATKYSTERGIYLTELSKKLVDLKSGARVITIDKRLQGPFNLISTVLDPNGDLQTSTGFLWQRQ